ncbi:MFS transporter [Nonomuraea sp. NPDC050663]|uniref:MFS transporter n=1 Tax=Nonomuraea sp. NPDC050663 TaxID=3364370 RepID=UPI0037A0B5EF
MRTYRELFAVTEFRTIFAGTLGGVAGGTMAMLAVSALVYAETGSPFLAAVAYLLGFLPQALGALLLGGWADRLPARALLSWWTLVRAVVIGLMAAGVVPVWFMAALGVGDAVAGAARQALTADLLPGEAYVLGRSTLNLAVGGMQIAGYGVAGLLMLAVGPQAALASAAAVELVMVPLYRFGLRRRRPRNRAPQRTFRFFAPGLLLTQWVPSGLIVGAEALFVPLAGESAGLLFMAAAGGMLAGDLVVGRWTDARSRLALGPWLYALLGLPYLAFFLEPGLVAAVALVGVASFGYAGQLGTQERYLAAVPERARGQALGLAASGMQSSQALAAAGTGTLAEFVPVPVAIALAGLASLTASVALARHIVRPVTPPGARPG